MRVTALGGPQNETRASIRPDGLEIFLQSSRTGTIGQGDLWISRRASTLDSWSTPLNLGTTINTGSAEQNPSVSSDGMTLFFASNRGGGTGGLDLYMTTRTLPIVRSKNISVAAGGTCVASNSPRHVDDGSLYFRK